MVEIAGKTDFTRTAAVELMPGVTVIVNSLSFGFDEAMAKDLPSPKPPMRMKRDARGNPVMRPGTKLIDTEPDEDNPEFKALEDLTKRHQGMYILYHGTKAGGSFKWKANPQGMQVADFCDAIYAELKAANMGFAYAAHLLQYILQLSGHTEEEVERVKGDFLSAGESAA